MSEIRSIYPILNVRARKVSTIVIDQYRFTSGGGGTAIALIANVGAGSATSNSVTTGAIDTTGANFLVAQVSYLDFGGAPTLTDSKGNTWTALTLKSSAFIRSLLYYCLGATVGSGHTFTLTGSSNYPSIAVAAFSNVKVSGGFDTESGAIGTPITSQQPGSLTPALDNSLLVTGLLVYNRSDVVSVDSGFTITDQVHDDGATHTGAALAYLIQTTKSAANPTWSWTNVATASAEMGVFKNA